MKDITEITDRDLAPINRVLGNYYHSEWLAARLELAKANKGLRRLQAKLQRVEESKPRTMNELSFYELFNELPEDRKERAKEAMSRLETEEARLWFVRILTMTGGAIFWDDMAAVIEGTDYKVSVE